MVSNRGSKEELGWLENHPSKFGLIVVSSVKSLVTNTLQSAKVNHYVVVTFKRDTVRSLPNQICIQF